VSSVSEQARPVKTVKVQERFARPLWIRLSVSQSLVRDDRLEGRYRLGHRPVGYGVAFDSERRAWLNVQSGLCEPGYETKGEHSSL